MRFRTGSSKVIVNVWTEEARQAAAEARKGKAKTPEHQEKEQGQKNYDALSPEEKEQFHTDWDNAQKATAKATKNPTAENHTKASNAHDKASKSAPTKPLQDHHQSMSEQHAHAASDAVRQRLMSSQMSQQKPVGKAQTRSGRSIEAQAFTQPQSKTVSEKTPDRYPKRGNSGRSIEAIAFTKH